MSIVLSEDVLLYGPALGHPLDPRTEEPESLTIETTLGDLPITVVYEAVNGFAIVTGCMHAAMDIDITHIADLTVQSWQGKAQKDRDPGH